MESQLKAKKFQLVEKLGVHIENVNHLAPVAARIMAYIILTGKAGTTFEDLVSDLCASKSTISTHLNHLQDINEISYFTKTGKRKKYFVVNTASLLQSISSMISQWESEKELHEEMSNYKIEFNKLDSTTPELQFDLTYHNNYINFLNLAMASMFKLKKEVEAMKFQMQP